MGFLSENKKFDSRADFIAHDRTDLLNIKFSFLIYLLILKK